ncbi:hypothetical protein AVHM3334_22010 [Acidovorax sp. SUPP3334]|nr:hypothetical protein AVHM3334_22010 [Acidovorax sp. SUPP3334]
MLTGILAGLAAGALWGLVFVAPRMAARFASVDLTSGRFIAYGAVAVGMLLWGLRPGQRARVRWPTAAQAASALGLSVPGFTGYYLLLLLLAIRDAGVEMPALIIGTIPVWVMLLGKPKGLRWAALVPGLALTLAGLGLMGWAPVVKPPWARPPCTGVASASRWWRWSSGPRSPSSTPHGCSGTRRWARRSGPTVWGRPPAWAACCSGA